MVCWCSVAGLNWLEEFSFCYFFILTSNMCVCECMHVCVCVSVRVRSLPLSLPFSHLATSTHGIIYFFKKRLGFLHTSPSVSLSILLTHDTYDHTIIQKRIYSTCKHTNKTKDTQTNCQINELSFTMLHFLSCFSVSSWESPLTLLKFTFSKLPILGICPGLFSL